MSFKINPDLKTFCDKIKLWNQFYQNDNFVKSKIEILSLIANQVTENPSSIIPNCSQLFINIDGLNQNNIQKTKITLELDPQLNSSLKGKGDAIVILGSLNCENGSKIPVAIKIAFKTNPNIDESYQDNSGEIEYEILLKIKDILIKKVSPNFIFPFIFQECDLNILFNNQNNLDQNFINSVGPKYIKNNEDEQRKFLNDQSMIIVMERGKFSFSNLIMSCIYDKDYTWDQFVLNIIDPVFFQVGHAIKVLILLGIIHHDLHMSNIFIDEYESDQELFFKTSFDSLNQVYKLETKYVPKLFDFDQSFLRGDENTGLTNTNLCKLHGICNTFNQKWDLYKFLMVFYSDLKYYCIHEEEKQDWPDKYRDLVTQRNWIDQSFLDIGISELYDPINKKEYFNLPDSKVISVDKFIYSFDQYKIKETKNSQSKVIFDTNKI